MQFLDAATVARHLDYPSLIGALGDSFAAGTVNAPLRTNHTLRQSEVGEDKLLMMPAWEDGKAAGVKLVTAMLAQPRQGQATINSIYMLFGANGAPEACLDGEALTHRRTAAVSALAARHLAREDSRILLMVGTGSLAPDMVAAHAAVHKLERILVWGRNPVKARDLAARLAASGLPAEAAEDLRAALIEADIVSCATTSRTPILHGAWLRPGQHIDLVGGFTPEMREADDVALTRATLFADTAEGVLAEAGDVVQPILSGVIDSDALKADLGDLCAGRHPGRAEPGEITLFKSVGTAAADLATACLAWSRQADTLGGAGA